MQGSIHVHCIRRAAQRYGTPKNFSLVPLWATNEAPPKTVFSGILPFIKHMFSLVHRGITSGKTCDSTMETENDLWVLRYLELQIYWSRYCQKEFIWRQKKSINRGLNSTTPKSARSTGRSVRVSAFVAHASKMRSLKPTRHRTDKHPCMHPKEMWNVGRRKS
jgi:hypothetical protein